MLAFDRLPRVYLFYQLCLVLVAMLGEVCDESFEAYYAVCVFNACLRLSELLGKHMVSGDDLFKLL